ncbi:host cell division inhibitor Icd-like protein, partial [Escherichia coli]|uniref:host cell division inhibitor Icd-like protein n=1 Tax=Escherichia coli TaxID=562 RepID=UPI00207BFBDF
RPEFIWRFYSCTKHTYISVMAATEAEARSFLPTDPCIFAARFKLDALDVLTYWNRPMNCVEVVDGAARGTFKRNRSRFIEGVDTYVIDYSEKGFLSPFGIDVPPRGLRVFTESGYLMIVKSFNDDLAWQVQRELVNSYFRIKQLIPEHSPLKSKAEIRSIVALAPFRKAFKQVMSEAEPRNKRWYHPKMGMFQAIHHPVPESPKDNLSLHTVREKIRTGYATVCRRSSWPEGIWVWPEGGSRKHWRTIRDGKIHAIDLAPEDIVATDWIVS